MNCVGNLHLMDVGRATRKRIDARRVGVPVECTLATYEERFGDGWMGQMLLQVCVTCILFSYDYPISDQDFEFRINLGVSEEDPLVTYRICCSCIFYLLVLVAGGCKHAL